jgi:hypothetical protein
MNPVDLKARLTRLGALAKGLAKEAGLWPHEEALFLCTQQRLYGNAILDALAGIEQARVVLAEVIERGEARRPA